MNILGTITDQDIDPAAPEVDRSSYFHRHAARAIVLDGAKIALLKASKHGYYKLPGGGMEGDEDPVDAVRREAQEEIGCDIDVIAEVGKTEEYRDKLQFHQSSYCYVAAVSGDPGEPSYTAHELDEGFQVVWAETADEALELVQSAEPNDYAAKFIQLRDSILLSMAIELLPSPDILRNL
jgi:8-oxo-dGTP diphosphatase